MIRCLLALPLLLGFAQDDAAIRDLIKRLDDPDLEVREKAVRELIKTGSKALEPLRKALASESAEVRTRAEQAIRAIEHELKSLEVCPPHKSFTLKRTAPLGELIDELARVTGLKMEVPQEERAAKLTVDASTLFQALDQICSARESLTWSFFDPGSVRFSSDRHVASPAAYFEAFKIFITEAQVLRKSDYKETTVQGRITLHWACEPGLKPLKRIQFDFATAKDDAGRDVEIVASSTMDMLAVGGGGIWMAAGFGDDADMTGPQTFALKGLAPEARTLALLKGTARVSFPISRKEVVFEDPQSRASLTLGDLTIRLKSVNTKKGQIAVTFTKAKGDTVALKEEISGRLDSESVRAVDEEGKEHIGELVPWAGDMAGRAFVMGGGPGGAEPVKSTQFQATFPTLEGKDFKKFRFRVAEALFEKSVPFEIKDVKLP